MPEELKGYKCPDKECYECEFLKTKEWLKEQNKNNNK